MSDAVHEEIHQYLTFSLNNDRYAFKVSKVKEVLEYQNITRVPKMPAFLLGVINVRGGIVPVVDLRVKFELPVREITVDSCIIVLEVTMNSEALTVGILADNVYEVAEILPSQIEPAPRIGTKLDTEYIDGIANFDGKFLVVFNIDMILSAKELKRLPDSDALKSQLQETRENNHQASDEAAGGETGGVDEGE